MENIKTNPINITLEIAKLMLMQAQASDPDWNENKINRSSDGRFAKNNNKSSTVKEVLAKQSIKNDEIFKVKNLPKKVNESVAVVMQQIGAASQMASNTFKEFTAITQSAIAQVVATLKKAAKDIQTQVDLSKERISGWCSQMKREFIDEPKQRVQNAIQPTIDKINKILDIPEVKVGLAIAAGVVALATYGTLDASSQHAVLQNIHDQIIWYIQDKAYWRTIDAIDGRFGKQIEELQQNFQDKINDLKNNTNITAQKLKERLDKAITKIKERVEQKQFQSENSKIILEDLKAENEEYVRNNRQQHDEYLKKIAEFITG